MEAKLTPHQLELLDAAALFFGTVDRAGRPDCGRCFGARVLDDGATLRVGVSRAWAAPVVANALNYETYQAKGRVISIEEATERDRVLSIESHQRFAEATISIGVHESVRDFDHVATIAVTFLIEQLYVQTPGPGAGASVA